VTTVIDLRSPAELLIAPNPFAHASVRRTEKAQGHGSLATGAVTYLHLPVVDDAGMRRLGEASDMFHRYLMMLDRRRDAFREIFTGVAEARGAVIFHCFAGKDRTGLVAAMLLELAGASDQTIAADFAETDLQLARKYEGWLAEAEPERRAELREELSCPPERILGVLDHLRRGWGGVAGYLEATGIPATGIDRLSAKLA
jgi:protein-tyrosine phosphatase